jgi:hypothetical protein
MPDTGSPPRYRGRSSSMRGASACAASIRSKADARAVASICSKTDARAVASVASVASVACMADSCKAERELAQATQCISASCKAEREREREGAQATQATEATEATEARRQSIGLNEMQLEKVDRQLHPPVC